jgi:GT2 family glycosyltransferase
MLKPFVTVVIVTYNSHAVVAVCLDALASQTYPRYYFQTVVVDNASRDGTVAFLREQYPQVRVLEQKRNLGFGRANNVAFHATTSDYIALINPDCEIYPDWLEQMVNFMEQHPQAGIAGSKIYYRKSQFIQHIGGEIGANLLTQHIGAGEFDKGQYEQPLPFPYVTGAALMFRRDVVQALGYFDEGYFMYYEETDLCWQVQRQGYAVLYCPQAKAVHNETQSLGQRATLHYLYYYHRSRLYFMTRSLSREQFRCEFYPAEKAWFRRYTSRRERLLLLYLYLLTLLRVITKRFQRSGHS